MRPDIVWWNDKIGNPGDEFIAQSNGCPGKALFKDTRSLNSLNNRYIALSPLTTHTHRRRQSL